MTAQKHALALVSQSLAEFDNVSLTASLRIAIRVARLIRDYDNLWWLEMELCSPDDESCWDRIRAEIASHYSSKELESLRLQIIRTYVRERVAKTPGEDGQLRDEGGTLPASVPHIERAIGTVLDVTDSFEPASSVFPQSEADRRRARSTARTLGLGVINEYRKVLDRISARVFAFLSSTEQALLENRYSSAFERTRRYVEDELKRVAPEALAELTAAHRRLVEGDPQSLSHALTSCRRLLKSLADAVYPPPAKPVLGNDGVERTLGEEQYIRRLWQFVHEQAGGHTSGNLILEEVEDIGHRIDRLYELTNKGVHASPSIEETEQCVVQCYFVAGDILRLRVGDSAAQTDST